jgi:glycosyltransferase involved in cell wall biosynthesis
MFAADLIAALDALGAVQRVVILRSSGGHSVDFRAPSQALEGGLLTRTFHLRTLVGRWRPHVIQAHGGEAMTTSVLALVDVPTIYRRIGGAPPSLRGGWRRFGYRRLVARSARVVAVAEAVRRESITLLRIPANRIVTIPNAVDPDRVLVSGDPSAVRQRLGIRPSAPLFLSVGALSWEKDPPTLLRVAVQVLRRMPDAVYVVVGDGPLRSRMETEVSSLGLSDRVRMLGVRSDAPDLLSIADAVLFASRPDGMEGLPGALIEAGMVCTPCVAYDVAGVSDVVVDGLTGRVATWGDEGALCDAMLEVLEDAAARERMGAAARQRCLAEFSIEKIAPQYLRLYEEVVR